MNWQSLIDTTKTLAKKTTPVISRVKWYWSDALAYVGKQVEQTPIFLKTEEEYNEFFASKRAILIAYDNRDAVSEDIRMMLPVWATQAWTDTAELKYIEISGNPDLVKILKITWPIEMRISYMREEYGRLSDIQAIKDWWKSRQYTRDDAVHKESSSINVWDDKYETDSPDPLLDIEKKPWTSRKKKIIH